MVKLFRAELTATGRPVLLSGEVERGMLDKVDLMFYGPGGVAEMQAEEYKDGYVVLTNYRLIWIGSRASASAAAREADAAAPPCHLPLPAVSAAEHKSGIVRASRLKLSVRLDSTSFPTPDPRNVACIAPLKMICRGPSPETLHSQLMAALQRQAWAAAPPGLMQLLHPAPAMAAAADAAVPGRVGPRPPGERAPPQDGGAAAGGLQPSRAIVEGLCAIGYPRLHAVNAVVATRNAGVQEAVNWLCDNEGSPALDQPSPCLDSVGGQAAGAAPSGGAAAASGYSSYPPPAGAGPLASGGVMTAPAGAAAYAVVDGSGTSFSNPLLQAQPGSAVTPAAAAPAAVRATGASRVGVSGILQQEQLRAARTDATMETALRDLSALMAKARDMVELAQYFRERTAARREGAAGEGEELDAETALDLLDLGIVSPVTRETAGSLYHQELSRQLADFLRTPLERAGGMMPLPDVYCLYNRARGVELVSPDDVLQAVRLFPKVRAPYMLREFSSGVKVVQSNSHSDAAICRRIGEMVQPQAAAAAAATAAPSGEDGGGAAAAAAAAAAAGTAAEAAEEAAAAALVATLGPAITRLEVAVALGVSLAVAGEHLRTAEAQGLLCRDEGPRGLVFFRNFFSNFAASTA